MAEDNKIWYAVGADTSGLTKDLERAKASFKGLTESTQNEGAKMDNTMVKLAASVGVAFSVQQAYQFAKAVTDVRGQFQLLEASFKVMLGSKAQTDQLMKEMIRSAAETPLQLTDIANGAKSLLAYGTAAEKVNDTLLMLGNVSTAMNIPLSEMVYLYGTTQVQGRLYTQDMRQFMGRGIPVVEELSKQLGVGKDKISDLVEAGKIGFPEIEKAFQSMTSQGGKFYNMMESQAKTIPGQISNLKDVFEAAMNDIGQESEGIISGTISGAKMVIENYEIIGKTIAGLVAVYGTYKAAIIVENAIQQIGIGIKIANIGATTAMTASQIAGTAATNLLTMAQARLNAVIMANPYAIAAAAMVAAVAAIVLLTDNTTSAERAQKSYDEQIKKTTEALEEHRQELDKNIQTATDMALTDVQRAGAINKLRKEYPDILAKYNLENLSLAEKLRLIKEINEAEGKKAIDANTNNVKTIDAQIAATQKRIKDLRGQDNINVGTANEIAANEKRLKDLQKVRQLSMQNVESDNVNAWTAKLKSLTDAQINAQLKERKRMMNELSKKKEGAVGEITGLGWFRSDEIKTQNAALEAEQSRRNAVVVQDKSFWEEQKKKAQETQDALGQDKINTKEWIEQQKLIDTADSKLRARNTSKKSGKNTDKNKDKEPEVFTKQLLEQARKQQDALYEIEQQNIDLEEEGVNREIRQNKLNHDKKIEEFKRQREDELQKLQDIEQAKWTDAGKKGKTTVTAELPAASISNYAALIKNENDLFEKANKETWTKALSEYQSFKDKQQKINADYTNAEKIINASTEPTDVKTAKLAEAKSIRDKDLKSLTDDLMRTVGLIDLMQGDGSDLIQKKIKQMLPLFEDISKLSHTELGKVKKAIAEIEFTPEQIAAIKEAGLSLEEFQTILARVKKASTETTEEQDWENLSKIINKVTSTADKLGNALQKTGGMLGTIGAGISAAAGAISTVTELNKPDAQNSDFAAAGISGLAHIYTMITNQIEANKKAQEEWNAKIDEAAQKARLARIELEAYKETNLFGVENPYEKVITGANQYAAAMAELNSINAKMGDGQVQTGTKKVVSGANVAKGAGAGAAIGAGIVGLFTLGIGIPLGAAIGAAIGGAVGAAETKTVPVFNSLKKQYGEIYNKETFELNPKILEDYDKLDDATKKMVDNWGEIKDKALEAQEQMKQTFSDLAGSIGDDLSNSLIEAFTGGDTNEAIDSFKGKMTDTIEAIIQKMIFAQYFESMFTTLEGKMNSSFGEGGDQNIIDDLLWFTTEYPKALEDYNAAMEGAQAELQKQGYDLFGQAGRTGASKGITTASQDTVDELNGRFTAVQGHTYSINETLKGMAANSAAMLGHLSNIDTHTFRLENIENFMNEVRAGINQINTKGINLKV